MRGDWPWGIPDLCLHARSPAEPSRQGRWEKAAWGHCPRRRWRDAWLGLMGLARKAEAVSDVLMMSRLKQRRRVGRSLLIGDAERGDGVKEGSCDARATLISRAKDGRTEVSAARLPFSLPSIQPCTASRDHSPLLLPQRGKLVRRRRPQNSTSTW